MSDVATLHYRFPRGDRTVRVRLSAPALLPLLESFYRGYRARDPGGNVRCTISLARLNGSYRLVGPSGDWRAEDEGEAVLYYESELTGALLEDAGTFVHLHGAAVRDASSCLLLIGPSGSGKSTLALGLHLRGMRALADDALLLDPASGALQPFDRSIRVHAAGLASLGLEPGAVPRARVCEPYLWLSPPPPGAEAIGLWRPSSMVFLEAGQAPALERLGAVEALRQLLLARLGAAPRRDFECLARLAAASPGYRLGFHSLREALGELERLCSDGLGP